MMTESTTHAAAAKYIDALERFSAQSMPEFLSLCSPEIEFRDPFNHTFNRNDFRRVLAHMVKQVDGLQFDVSGHWLGEDSLVIRWRFTGRARFVGRLDIPGLSEVAFDENAMVCRHIDYWDANEHITCKLPVIGPSVRLAMRPMSI